MTKVWEGKVYGKDTILYHKHNKVYLLVRGSEYSNHEIEPDQLDAFLKNKRGMLDSLRLNSSVQSIWKKIMKF